MPERCYGFDRAIALVRSLMERPEDGRSGMPRSRRTPVLVFVGPRGSGKTTLLDEVRRELDQHVPYAHLDFERIPVDAGPRDVLTRLAFALNRQCPTYGRVGFPRFFLGRLVLGQQGLDLSTPPRTRAEIRGVLEQYRSVGKLKNALGDLASQVLGSIPQTRGVPGVGSLGGYVPGLVLDLLERRPRTRRMVLGAAQEWYGHQDRGLRNDPLDELVALCTWAAGDGRDDRDNVDDLLLRAFLADLRHGFDHGRAARRRSLNCVVLLDNADTRAGRDFLRKLVSTRRELAARGDVAADPLTVVATGRDADSTLSHVLADGGPLPSVEEAGYDDYCRRAVGQFRPWWYPVGLRNLTEAEAESMLADLGLGQGANMRTARLVHRFTQGHPGATRLMLRAIAEAPTPQTDLAAVLTLPEPGDHKELTVEERLIDGFLQGFPPDAADALTTCSAARDEKEASRLAGHDGPLAGLADERSAIFGPGLWTRDEGDKADGPRVMLPVLRRLLLRKLAERDDEHPANWQTVHGWLGVDAAEHHDDTGKLQHALACGEMEHVTLVMATRLRESGVDAWLALLHTIVEAPRRRPVQTPASDPYGPLTAPLSRLITSLWAEADPLGDSRRQHLHGRIAAAYDAIAEFSPDGSATLYNTARHYRELGEDRTGTPADRRTTSLPAVDASRRDFRPPVPSGLRTLRRRRRLAVAALAAAVAAGGIWRLQEQPPHSDMCAAGVIRVAGDCLGVTTLDSPGSFRFRPDELGTVEHDIMLQNEKVEKEGSYVTIAYLGPLTASSNPTKDRIRFALEGAYLGQKEANDRGARVRLVLANDGADTSRWQPAVDGLAGMVGGSARLVAVVGLVLSTSDTEAAAKRLAQDGIPMVGDMITADGLDNGGGVDGLFRVAPPNDQAVRTLAQYVADKRRDLRTALLVKDTSPRDLYTGTLVRDFQTHFKAQIDASGFIPQPYDATNPDDAKSEFASIARNLCGNNPPDMVLYAGREALLPDFVTGLAERNCLTKKPIPVLTGDDATALTIDNALSNPHLYAPVEVIYTAPSGVLKDPSSSTNRAFNRLESEFGESGFPTEPDLIDESAVLAHDAVTTAADAVHNAGARPDPKLVSSELGQLSTAASSVSGATGTFELENGNPICRPILVFQLTAGTGRQGSTPAYRYRWTPPPAASATCPKPQ